MVDNFSQLITCDDLNEISESDLLKDDVDQLFPNYLGLPDGSYENIVFGNDLTHPIPNHWHLHPTLDELNSEYECEVTLNSETSGKGSWMHSQLLNKIFIKMNQTIVMNVSYKKINNELIKLRAMIVFTDKEDLHLAVKRCAHHISQDKKKDNEDIERYHILRCCRLDTKYEGINGEEKFIDRLALTVPLGKHAVKSEDKLDQTINENLSFYFVCQNSCTSGINRKCTSVVFTFENEKGDLIGRKTMQFKVCSAPKRDKEKEEEAITSTKRKSHGDKNFIPPGKRCKVLVKTENVSPVASPNPSPVSTGTGLNGVTVSITMPNVETMLHVLRCARNEITGHSLFQNNPENMVPYISDIEKVIDQVKQL